MLTLSLVEHHHSHQPTEPLPAWASRQHRLYVIFLPPTLLTICFAPFRKKTGSYSPYIPLLTVAVYNILSPGTHVVDHDTCLRALQGPLSTHAVAPPPGSRIAKWGNPCWGSTNNDYEGGYYQVNNIGAFGSEIYRHS